MRFLCLISGILLLGCTEHKTHFQSEEALNAYVSDPDNGFIQSVETAEFFLESKVTPSIHGDSSPQITIQLRLNRIDGGSVLDFGGVDKQEALVREGYLSFEVLQDVYLESGEEIFPAIFHHYERNYGLKPSVDLVFVFNHFSPREDVYLNYRDQIFGQGLMRIKLAKELFTTCYVSK